MAYYFGAYAALRDALAPGVPLINEEAATQAGGGCEGLSDRFVSGFWWIHTLGLAAASGVARVHRQDVAGFSFNRRASHYQLAGVAGWVNASASGPLTPHPDWYATVLHKQLTGSAALSSTLSAAPSVNASLAVHAWCAAPAAGTPPGGVTLSFVNMGALAVSLHLLAGPATQPRIEYFVEAEGAARRRQKGGHSALSQLPPPTWLTADSATLNGSPLTVDEHGRLPAYPIPGRTVPAGSGDPQLPPWSYGFVVLPSAGATACRGL
jgi:hypothetical protein